MAELVEIGKNRSFEESGIEGTLQSELSKQFPNGRIGSVLLIAPPDCDESLFDFQLAKRRQHFNYPPYGLGIIAAHLEKREIKTTIANLNNTVLESARLTNEPSDFNYPQILRDAIQEAITGAQPDLIGLSCMFSQTHQSLVDVIEIIRSMNDEIPIAVGGVHITSSFTSEKMRASLLDDMALADYLFLYEAEFSFLNFIDVVAGTLNASHLNQVFFNRTTPKLLFSDTSQPPSDDLNILPAHDLMRSSELSCNGKIGSFYSLLGKNAKLSTALSNRGCRAQCTFCSVRNFNGIGVRRRSAQSVIDELLALRHDHGIDHIMWLDDDFLYDRKASIHLFNEMVRQNVGLTWDCTNGVIAASCTDDVISAAAESGCIGLNIGMESGNPEILKTIRKPGTVEVFLSAAQVLRKYESINARLFLMIGFPGETYGQIWDSIKVSSEMDLDWVNVTILQPLPNTPIFDTMVSDGLIDDVDFSDIRCNAGPIGKHRTLTNGLPDPLAIDFRNTFNDKDFSEIPSPTDLDKIWAFMNFHLNFRRLFFEERPAKILQNFKYVNNIARNVAPGNAFANYFNGYLTYRMTGEIPQEITTRFRSCLEDSTFWRERCDEFGLESADLKNCDFQRHRTKTQAPAELAPA